MATTLRNRKHPSIRVPLSQEIETRDDIFGSLGIGWNLFKEENYERAFNHLYLASKCGNYFARYLLGRFYEFGLVDNIDYNMACKYYSSVYANTTHPFLKSEAERGIQRIISKIE